MAMLDGGGVKVGLDRCTGKKAELPDLGVFPTCGQHGIKSTIQAGG
jgi:hypothetical protein